MSKNITKLKHRFPLKHLRLIGKYLSRTWPVTAILLITGLLIFLNYEPYTYLTGWDNLHPEFDISENLKRIFFSVWQEYRGPGLLGGMAHAADLPRTLLVALLLLIKTNPSLIRYITTFIPLVVGPLGVYFLFYHHLFKGKLDSRTIQFASFLGSLYYLLNLNTLQTFFVPFETFTWFYGSLPWLLYFVIFYLTKPSTIKFFALFIVSFISAPSFYVETIFVVFFVALLPFFIEYLAEQKHKIAHIKSSALAMTSLITPHLFWLLPVAFFVITNGHIPEQAKNNLLSSPETYARNLQFATLKDTALIKGYLFNYLDLGADNKYTYLMTVWRNHLNISIINLTGFLSFILILTGLYYSFKKKFTWTKSFVGVLSLCLFFLLGGGLLIKQIPLVGELFRSPFTKFSIPLSLAYSFFFAIGSIFLLDLFTFLHTRLTYYLTLFTVAFSLILFMSPAFSGNLIAPSMRRTIPAEYFELFDYMKTQDPATRIGTFPQFSFWGWESYDWGYRGSGFLWYGLRQPIMHRAFDAWDKNSERYYEELSAALYGHNLDSFEKVIDKYSINWLLVDEHVSLPENATDSGMVTLKKFITNSERFSLNKKFGEQISLYQVSNPQNTKNFLSVQSPKNKTLPFESLTLRPNTDWIQNGDYLNINTKTKAKEGDTLVIPSLSHTESILPVLIEYRKHGGSLDLKLTPIIPTIFVNKSQLDLQSSSQVISIPGTTGTGYILELNKNYFELQLPAEIDSFTDYYPLTTTYLPTQKSFSISLFSSSEIAQYDITNALSESNPEQCYIVKPNHKVEKLSIQNGFSLIGTDVVGCLSATLPSIGRGNLIALSFTYSSPTLTSANVNISGPDLNAQNLLQPFEPKEKPTRARLYVPSTGSTQLANFLLEAGETKTVKEIDYSDVEVSVLPYIYSSSVLLPTILEKQIVLKGDVNSIQVSLKKTNTAYDILQTPLSNNLFPENQNCDQFNNGETVKQVTPDGFIYQSKNAVQCDTLNLRHLPHTTSYLLTFEYQLQKGLAGTVCLENHSSRRCDVHERLIETNTAQSIIQPIINPEEDPGYTLHFYVQSFGSRVSTSLLKSLTIRPIPLRFIQDIEILSAENEASKVTLTGSTHQYPFLYTASVENSQASVLNLYQTKSASWKALQVSQNDLKLPSWLLTATLPITSPLLPKLSQAENNLWHNSFTLSDGNSSIAIVYLPQYLEFAGLFIMIALPTTYLATHLFKKRKKKKN